MLVSEVYLKAYNVDAGALINIYTDQQDFINHRMPIKSDRYEHLGFNYESLSVKQFEIVSDNLINVLIYTI